MTGSLCVFFEKSGICGCFSAEREYNMFVQGLYIDRL